MNEYMPFRLEHLDGRQALQTLPDAGGKYINPHGVAVWFDASQCQVLVLILVW
jgi:hypothetical protein